MIPTNVPITRIDHDDVIYMTKNEKYNAIINEIEYWHTNKKPVLVGTVTVETSETLSRLLQRKKIEHKVLNAKFHQSEAEIVANAGQPGSVTIATNMAGRGTDIKLGLGVIQKAKSEYLNIKPNITEENPFGEPLDGLHIIGTERHESRRIDRQLRGRAGRQGDPGTSRFYLSLEDDLMRLFGSEKISPLMMKLGLKPGDAIQHPWMSKTVENAQKKVEGRNFEIRKQLIKYDEVMNQQRDVIYTYRRNVLKGYDLKNDIIEMMENTITNLIEENVGDSKYHEDWPLDTMIHWVENYLRIKVPMSEFNFDRMNKEIFTDTMLDIVKDAYQQRENLLGADILREIERHSLLMVVDTEWRDHLHEMDILKEGISFRAYANKDPLVEYKKESYKLFSTLIYRIHEGTTKRVFNSLIVTKSNEKKIQDFLKNATMRHDSITATQLLKEKASRENQQKQPEGEKQMPKVNEVKIGRNDPCPCGSGKKYKKCCGSVGNEEE